MSDQERLTPERLEELRRVAEAATDAIERALFNNNPDAVRSAERGLHVLLDALATQADEIERLRREREMLLNDMRQIDYLAKCLNGGYGRKFPPLPVRSDDFLEITKHYFDRRGYRKALALLEAEKGGNVNPLAAYTDGQLYDELHRRGWVAATWPTKGGGGA